MTTYGNIPNLFVTVSKSSITDLTGSLMPTTNTPDGNTLLQDKKSSATILNLTDSMLLGTRLGFNGQKKQHRVMLKGADCGFTENNVFTGLTAY